MRKHILTISGIFCMFVLFNGTTIEKTVLNNKINWCEKGI